MNTTSSKPVEVKVVLKPFRGFVTQQYYANRDEYEHVAQTQPYTFAEYYALHRALLAEQYRAVRASGRS